MMPFPSLSSPSATWLELRRRWPSKPRAHPPNIVLLLTLLVRHSFLGYPPLEPALPQQGVTSHPRSERIKYTPDQFRSSRSFSPSPSVPFSLPCALSLPCCISYGICAPFTPFFHAGRSFFLHAPSLLHFSPTPFPSLVLNASPQRAYAITPSFVHSLIVTYYTTLGPLCLRALTRNACDERKQLSTVTT